MTAVDSAVSFDMYQGNPEYGYPLNTLNAQQISNPNDGQIDPQYPIVPPAAHSQQFPFNVNEITREQKDKDPWIYRGYHAFSKWMSTDRDFYVLRQFSETSVRVALYMQDEIADLEEQLRNVDVKCMRENMDNGTMRFDPVPERRWILAKLAKCIRNYHQFIINQRLLQQSGGAADFQIQNVKNWLKAANDPIQETEAMFVEKTRDLIPVLVSDITPFRSFLERFKLVWRILPTQKKKLEEFATDDFERTTTHPTDSRHLDRFVFCFIVISGLGMLIGPLWWLNSLAVHGPNLAPRLGVITGFLIAFVLLICLLTNARPFEVLAATAAYGAVLMVFIQLQQPH